MSDASLSPTEIEALRDATREQGGVSVDTVELAASDRQAKRRLPALRSKLDVVLKRNRQALSRALHVNVECSWAPVELAGPMAMAQEVTDALMGAIIRLKANQEPLAWVALPPAMAFHLIEVAFGGPACVPGPQPQRVQLTPLERDTLWPFLQDAAQALIAGLSLELAGALEVVPTGYPVRFGGLRTQESGVVLHVLTPLGSTEGRLNIVLAPKALEFTDAPASGAQRAARLESAADAMLLHVSEAQVLLVATLGTTSVSVGELMDLQVGQMIWLEHSQTQPIEISIEGHPKFTAMPMQRAGAVGVQIMERVG